MRACMHTYHKYAEGDVSYMLLRPIVGQELRYYTLESGNRVQNEAEPIAQQQGYCFLSSSR